MDGGLSQEPACSFCETPKSQVFKLIAGPAASLCDRCVVRCRTLAEGDLPSAEGPSSTWALLVGGRVVEEAAGERKRTRSRTEDQTLVDVDDLPLDEILAEPPERPAAASAPVEPPAPTGPECSFCERPRAEVRYLVAGPKAHICDECLGLCEDIIAEARAAAGEPDEPARA